MHLLRLVSVCEFFPLPFFSPPLLCAPCLEIVSALAFPPFIHFPSLSPGPCLPPSSLLQLTMEAERALAEMNGGTGLTQSGPLQTTIQYGLAHSLVIPPGHSAESDLP